MIMDEEIKVILEWIVKNLPSLRASGYNWQLVLHGGADGRVTREVKTTGDLVAPRRKNQVRQEQQ